MRTSKRKRDDDDEDSPVEVFEGIETEKPKEGMKQPKLKKKKRQEQSEDGENTKSRINKGTETGNGPNEADKTSVEGKISKKDRRKEKKERKKARQISKEQKKDEQPAEVEHEDKPSDDEIDGIEVELASKEEDGNKTIKPQEVSDSAKDSRREASSSTSPSLSNGSPQFDQSTGQSAASSASSIVPSATIEKIKNPSVDSETLRARLQARIEALRAARKADGPDGRPARNRQELIEARRRKEEQRKAHKRELRLKAKEAERAARDRTMMLSRSPDIFTPPSKTAAQPGNNFSFGHIAFNDGQQVDASGSSLLNQRARKGPQDSLGAMKAAESKQARLKGLDEGKRKDIEDKDMWLNAKKRVHGEKIRDDTSLLKKTLQRQQKAKKKSESEWQERLTGVEKGKEMRQQKREENLRKRKEDKGQKGKKKGKVQKRPGFEGSFRAKPKSRPTNS